MIKQKGKAGRRAIRRVGTGDFNASLRMVTLVNKVLASGRLSYGPMSKRFEREFARLHGCRYGILSNSGTSSLHVALQAMKEIHGWRDGDEVIVPASTFVATVNVVLHNRLKPVLADITVHDYGLNPREVVKKLTNRTRAIIPVHLYGQPCNMRALMAIADRYSLKIIEDSCECMFAAHHGMPVGSMGDIGCFSLYNAHIITAGVGGIATTSNPDYAKVMRSLVNHGLDIQELNTDENFSPRPVTGRSFRFSLCGHSYRITELEAALALAQLEDWQQIIKTRRRNARHLRTGLRNIEREIGVSLWYLPSARQGNTHSWMMFPILLRRDVLAKEKFIRCLNALGIETRDMMPIVSQPIYKDWIRPEDYPVSKYVDENGFYIGCHPGLTPDDIEYVLQVFRDYIYETCRV